MATWAMPASEGITPLEPTLHEPVIARETMGKRRNANHKHTQNIIRGAKEQHAYVLSRINPPVNYFHALFHGPMLSFSLEMPLLRYPK